MQQLSIIGVPSSAGSFAAGQEKAPKALREAGLVNALREHGVAVNDLGDLPEQVWRPDPGQPLWQNLGQVIDSLVQLRRRLRPVLAERSGRVLVLGGNCTVALGVIAAMNDVLPNRPGLLYIDRHLDMNTPDSTPDGALDWMGLGHALGVPGHLPELASALGQRPLLLPEQIAVVGTDIRKLTGWEAQESARLGLHVVTSSVLRDAPAESARRSLEHLPSGPIHVHVDVDVLDFTDAPLAEDTGGRNTGPRLNDLTVALSAAAHDPRMVALSVGELNRVRLSWRDSCGGRDRLVGVACFVDSVSFVVEVEFPVVIEVVVGADSP
jgi:arginase